MTYFIAQPAWLTVAFGVIAVLLVYGFVVLGYPGRIAHRYGVKVPEASITYSRQEVMAFLRTIGPSGLRTYRIQLGWDMVFAILLMVPLVAILDAVLATSLPGDSAWRILVFLPVVYAAVDVLEDVLLLGAVRRVRYLRSDGSEPDPDEPCEELEVRDLGSLVAAQAATFIKFVAIAGSLALIAVGGVNHVVDSA
jgi:hypothetical protein